MTEIITIAGLVALCFIGFIIIKTVLANQQRRKVKSQARQAAWEKAQVEIKEQEAVTQRTCPSPAQSHGKQYLQHPPDLRYPEEIDPNCKILYSEPACPEPPTQRKTLSDVVSGKVVPTAKPPTCQTRVYTKPTRAANPSSRDRSQNNSFNFPDYAIIPTSVAVFDDTGHSPSPSYEGHGGSFGGAGATADWSAPDTSSSSFDSGGGGFDSGSSGGFGGD